VSEGENTQGEDGRSLIDFVESPLSTCNVSSPGSVVCSFDVIESEADIDDGKVSPGPVRRWEFEHNLDIFDQELPCHGAPWWAEMER